MVSGVSEYWGLICFKKWSSWGKEHLFVFFFFFFPCFNKSKFSRTCHWMFSNVCMSWSLQFCQLLVPVSLPNTSDLSFFHQLPVCCPHCLFFFCLGHPVSTTGCEFWVSCLTALSCSSFCHGSFPSLLSFAILALPFQRFKLSLQDLRRGYWHGQGKAMGHCLDTAAAICHLEHVVI